MLAFPPSGVRIRSTLHYVTVQEVPIKLLDFNRKRAMAWVVASVNAGAGFYLAAGPNQFDFTSGWYIPEYIPLFFYGPDEVWASVGPHADAPALVYQVWYDD